MQDGLCFHARFKVIPIQQGTTINALGLARSRTQPTVEASCLKIVVALGGA